MSTDFTKIFLLAGVKSFACQPANLLSTLSRVNLLYPEWVGSQPFLIFCELAGAPDIWEGRKRGKAERIPEKSWRTTSRSMWLQLMSTSFDWAPRQCLPYSFRTCTSRNTELGNATNRFATNKYFTRTKEVNDKILKNILSGLNYASCDVL